MKKGICDNGNALLSIYKTDDLIEAINIGNSQILSISAPDCIFGKCRQLRSCGFDEEERNINDYLEKIL